MKLLYRTLIILVIFAGFASCDDEPIGERFDNSAPVNAQFKVDIDGQTFYADNSGVLTEDGYTQIVGKRNDGHQVKITFQGSGTGDFILNGTPNGNGYYYDDKDEPYSMEGIDTIGVVSITKYDVSNELASGTFSFRAARTAMTIDTSANDSTATPTITHDTIELTNGEFTNIPLQTDLAPPPGEVLGNFHVKLDGELYTGNNIQSAITSNEGLVISTSNGPAQFILQVFNPEVGSFDLGDGTNGDGLIIYNPDSTDEEGALFGANQGSISISQLDDDNHVVSGTFSGTLASVDDPDSTITMTEGVFENISYETEVAEQQFINAKIGNEDFNSSDIITTDGDNNIVHVVGTDQLDNQLQLNIPSNVNTGSYDVQAQGAFSAIYSETDADTGDVTQYKSFNNSGSFTIESVNGNMISGTFMFSVSNDAGEVRQVTEGEFKFEL